MPGLYDNAETIALTAQARSLMTLHQGFRKQLFKAYEFAEAGEEAKAVLLEKLGKINGLYEEIDALLGRAANDLKIEVNRIVDETTFQPIKAFAMAQIKWKCEFSTGGI